MNGTVTAVVDTVVGNGSEQASRSGARLVLWRIGAVFAGVLTNAIPAMVIDEVLHATGVYPAKGVVMSAPLFLLAAAYRTACALGGGYVTARLAPDRPMRHALVLGLIGVALSTLGTVVMWGFGPAWYPLYLVAISLPVTWVGARLQQA